MRKWRKRIWDNIRDKICNIVYIVAYFLDVCNKKRAFCSFSYFPNNNDGELVQYFISKEKHDYTQHHPLKHIFGGSDGGRTHDLGLKRALLYH